MTEINQDALKLEIKQLIVSTLNIKDVEPADILDDVPLFSGENTIGLDSIDAIELIMAIQRQFAVRLDDQNLARNILNSINSIAEFITAEKQK
ncbi:MAG: phosphopantetheine-binding protein [Bacteroidota bacterium]|jgi:acyl carrier protein